jgi:crotonobetainyl-CoA:carnitine CoA-transferase CaiB-like acyl-CoA transferase
LDATSSGNAEPEGWARDLAAAAGRPRDAGAHALHIASRDPVLPTRFRVGEAAAAAIGAQALAAADLWRLRGGAPQSIEVDVRAAAASLLSFLLLRLPGVSLLRGAPATVALYRARDGGWIHLHGGFPQLHAGTLSLLGCGEDAASIARAVAQWDAPALEDALALRGLCGARLRSAEEWLAHPQGAALSRAPLVEMVRIGDADPGPLPGPRAGAPGARPLSCVRVLDLTRVLAGPTCARTLAEHGAEVLHVRSPHLPSIEPFVIDTNPGKRSCHLDLERREDADRLRALVRGADVFSQGYRAGALARRGFGPEELAALRPGLVAVSIDCYGHEGPWAPRPGWEQLAQTASGMAQEHAGSDAPAVVPAAVTDYTTGHLAALGAMAALARRAAEGGSWHVRVSLARTAMWIQSLPRTPGDASPSGVDPAALAPWWIEMDTAWGRLGRLGPIACMSATPPRWDLPPVPLGSHPASWLEASPA